MTDRARKGPLRSFQNIDVDLRSQVALDPLLEALGDHILVLNHGPHDAGWFASIELAASFEDAEAVAARLCGVFEALTGEGRVAWNTCTERVFNLGFASWNASPRAEAHCQESRLSPETLRRIAALGAGLTISVYAR